MRGDLHHLTKVESRSLRALTKQVLGERGLFSHNEGKCCVYIAQPGRRQNWVRWWRHVLRLFSLLCFEDSKIQSLLWSPKKKKLCTCHKLVAAHSKITAARTQEEKCSGFLWARGRRGLRCCRSGRVLFPSDPGILKAPRPVLLGT